MKIYFSNYASSNIELYHNKKDAKPINKNFSTTKNIEYRSISFGFAGNVNKTVTSQIRNEKIKLLKQIKNILETDIPIFTEEERLFALVAQAHRMLEAQERRKEQIKTELQILQKTKGLNDEMIYSNAQALLKEYKSLKKFKLVENLPEPKKTNESYDYALVNKFKTALLEDNFNFGQIYIDHYAGLEDINTVEELAKKYPTIKIPSNARDIVAKKITDSMPRIFYEELLQAIHSDDHNSTTNVLFKYTKPFIKIISSEIGVEENKLYDYFLSRIINDLLEKMMNTLQKFGNFKSIPEIRKQALMSISDIDMKLLLVDYDKFITSVLKEHYIHRKKLNDIEYKENGQEIKVSTLKAPEYKFEKFSEKIKALITAAEKIKMLQKNYSKFTTEELQDKLNFYAYEAIGNNEKILGLIVDFNSCKFTEEDRQYLIKFLQILDKIQEKEISLQEGLDEIKANKIKPHGTNKLNEIEKKELEKAFKIEQQNTQALAKLREDFDNALNILYAKKLVSVAETCSKYYPNNYNKESIEQANFIIDLIQTSIKENNPALIRNNILRYEIYNHYVSSGIKNDAFKAGMEYANNFSENNPANRCGQYLLKRQIIENYPESRNMAINPDILDTIIEKHSGNIDLATKYLCKYEDYWLLDKVSKSSILKITEFFDTKNSSDKAILKNIIENEYINTETISYNNLIKSGKSIEIKITPSAKQAILKKYQYPNCIEVLSEFEEATRLIARAKGSAGIKQVGRNEETLEHKIEVKINSRSDRLFSSENNFVFDIYSEDGLH